MGPQDNSGSVGQARFGSGPAAQLAQFAFLASG